MNGETPSWAAIRQQYHEMFRRAVAELPAAFSRSGVLLAVVLLSGWLSYESLYGLALALGWSSLAAAAFPLQLDFAAIPAYRVAADTARHWTHRWFGVFMVALTLGGSIYGNLVAHFRWGGPIVTIFASVISPTMCAMTLVLWHLPRAARAVVAARRFASRWTKAENPPETSPTETEVTPEPVEDTSGVGTEEPGPKETPSTLGTPGVSEVRQPEGDWSSRSGSLAVRSYASAFRGLNHRRPTSAEVYLAMPLTREHRNVPAVLKSMSDEEVATG